MKGRIIYFVVLIIQFQLLCLSIKAQESVGLIAPDLFTDNNSVICVPVSTRNFNKIAAFQVGIRYDPDILEFDEERMASLDFVSVGTNPPGEIRILWVHSIGTNSVSLEDESILFELCFNVIGDIGDKSEFTFANLFDYSIEFANSSEEIPYFVDSGSITVGFIIPTLSEWSVVCLSLTLLILGVLSFESHKSNNEMNLGARPNF